MKSLTSVAALFSLLWCLSFSHAFTTTTKSSSFVNAMTRVRSSNANNALSMSMADGGVVITGAAGGVGFAYAGEFMDRGYNVVICDVKDCSAAANALTARHPNGNVYHTKCDVSDVKSVNQLGQFAKEKLGTVGYWINNAGVNGGRRALRDVPVEQVELVVKVNLLGTLLGTKVAMDIMAEQVRSDVMRFFCCRDPFTTLIVIEYSHDFAKGWCHRSHFQHCGERCQGRRNSRVRYLRCNQTRIATVDCQSCQGIRRGCAGVQKERNCRKNPGAQPLAGNGIYKALAR